MDEEGGGLAEERERLEGGEAAEEDGEAADEEGEAAEEVREALEEATEGFLVKEAGCLERLLEEKRVSMLA